MWSRTGYRFICTPSDKELLEILKKHDEELSGQVNAEKVSFTRHTGGFHKEWEIDEAAVQIAIEKK